MNLDELVDQLHRSADSVELRAGSPGEAKALGRRRRYRRRRMGLAAGAVATIGVTTAGLHQLTRPRERIEPGAPTASAPEAPAPQADRQPLARAEPALVWRRVDPDSAAAVATHFNSGAYLAPTPALPGVVVSTGPAVSESPARHLWRSDDGISWTEVGPLPDGATAAATWSSHGRIYAVGTMPGAADTRSDRVRVSISDDGAATWRGIDLPADNPELAAMPHVTHVISQIAGIAGAGDTTLVLLNQRAGVEQPALLTELGFDPERASFSEDGVTEYTCDDPVSTADVGSCTEDATKPTIPWSELGDAGAALRRSMYPQPRLFASTDGATFTEVDLPGASGVDTQLYPVGDGAVLAAKPAWEAFAHDLWFTSDGSSWAPLAAPPFGSAAVQPFAGGLISVGSAGDGSAAVATSSNGAQWTGSELSDLYDDGEVPFVYVGPAVNAHGVTMAATVQTPEVVVDGTPTLAAANPTTTTTIVLREPASIRLEILHSVDGIAWSRESVAELAGVDESEISNVNRVQTAGDSVVVAVTLKAPEGEVPRQLVLVGTPAG